MHTDAYEAYQQAHRTFITFHDGKPLEPHIKNKSHDFNMKQKLKRQCPSNWRPRGPPEK